MQIDEFNSKNMGAKSNNIKVLKDGLESWIILPQSGCIPFNMMEYTLDMHEDIKKELNNYIDQLTNVKTLKKMNRLLYKCKELVLSLKYKSED